MAKTKTPQKAPRLRIRVGDIVQVITGKDRGKQGRVIETYPREGRVLVENLNVSKKHRRPKVLRDTGRMGQQSFQEGGIVDLASPIRVANVMIVCPGCDRPTRIGHEVKETKDGLSKVRVCSHAECREVVDRE
jgi:large subunit ribosomal protein L24